MLASTRRSTFDFPAVAGHDFFAGVYATKEGARIGAGASVDLAQALSIPGPSVVGEGQPSYTLDAFVDQAGIRGSIMSESDTAARCRRARWPVERVCGVCIEGASKQTPVATGAFGSE